MELANEVQELLQRVKRLSQQAQRNENYSNFQFHTPLNSPYSSRNLQTTFDEIDFCYDDILPIESMDFSDDERWLYVSTDSMVNPFTGNLTEWLHEDFQSIEDDISELESVKHNAAKHIDTRTFTRPKKRISRPSLDQLTDEYHALSNSSPYLSTESIPDSIIQRSMHSLKEDPSAETISEYYSVASFNSNVPVQFKLSEPVSNHSFDKILETASENIDSFQNMSPPSLINSLCSSTNNFENGGCNHDVVPNDKSGACDRIVHYCICSENPRITYSNDSKNILENLLPKNCFQKSMNNISNIQNKNSESLNKTYANFPFKDLNVTKTKNVSNKSGEHLNLSGTNTITKKPKEPVYNTTSKLSDKNQTFIKDHDSSLDLTFKKMSGDQPHLMEDLKRTILHQSMELMQSSDVYHTARSDSVDSLDELSSSISTSSKDSGKKRLNTRDTKATTAKEQDPAPTMSTPKQRQHFLSLLEGDRVSPIIPTPNRRIDEYLSDSDLSDSYIASRSKAYEYNSPPRINCKAMLEALIKPDTIRKTETFRRPDHCKKQPDQCKKPDHYKKPDHCKKPDHSKKPDYCKKPDHSKKPDHCKKPDHYKIPDQIKHPIRMTKQSAESRVKQVTKTIENDPEVSQPTLRIVPTMIVKPLEVERPKFQSFKSKTAPQTPTQAKQRPSGLPRPLTTASGIPRPSSRIPAPKPRSKSQVVRPTNRAPARNDWMDGCY